MIHYSDSCECADCVKARRQRKVYLGDGVYVDFDGYMLVLTTEHGIDTTNTIHLEPKVYSALTQYVERGCWRRRGESRTDATD